MGYHAIDPDTLAPTPDYPCDRRPLADTAGLANLAAAMYTVGPGEQLARSYHFHEQREELFYVITGTLSIRTPEEHFAIGPDEIFVAEPGSPFLPYVPESAAESARVIGVGAPAFDVGQPYEPE
ncbi:MAG: cupin domain-containing protein [Salinirussus sp.]